MMPLARCMRKLTQDEPGKDDDHASNLDGTMLWKPDERRASESRDKDASREDEQPAGNHACLEQRKSVSIRSRTVLESLGTTYHVS
mgnify:CR=1 FL=1